MTDGRAELGIEGANDRVKVLAHTEELVLVDISEGLEGHGATKKEGLAVERVVGVVGAGDLGDLSKEIERGRHLLGEEESLVEGDVQEVGDVLEDLQADQDFFR